MIIQFRPNFHLECFTCDDLPNFIEQTQVEANNQADEDKTLLGISKKRKNYSNHGWNQIPLLEPRKMVLRSK